MNAAVTPTEKPLTQRKYLRLRKKFLTFIILSFIFQTIIDEMEDTQMAGKRKKTVRILIQELVPVLGKRVTVMEHKTKRTIITAPVIGYIVGNHKVRIETTDTIYVTE